MEVSKIKSQDQFHHACENVHSNPASLRQADEAVVIQLFYSCAIGIFRVPEKAGWILDSTHGIEKRQLAAPQRVWISFALLEAMAG